MNQLSEKNNHPIYGEGGGKGGGGKSHTPTEAANTLQSKAIARVIDLISEGEIIGLYTGEGGDGKDNPLKAVYFDNIPVMALDGSLNFEGVTMHERVGLPDQDAIPGFSEVESEITINQQVTDASPVLFTIADNDVDAIRVKLRIPALYEQTSKGDLVAAELQFKVEVQPSGGSYTEIINDTVDGKNTSPYERQHRIDLSSLGTFPLTFRVTRVTPDSDKASKQTDLYVNSYTEIQESNLSYPDSAMIAIEVDSELFSGRVPKRSYYVRGIKIQIPSNYNPITRVYTGIWDGTFQTAWSNNPAWVLYDVLTSPRYGLGEFITDEQVDKFALYTIGQYCDELIDTGLGDGTTEPRFVFNGVINTRRDAYDVVNAITSTFRGMNFWSAGGVTAVADSPKDPTRLVTRANVIDGRFEYSGTALRSRHSAALISWNDPHNNFEQTIEVYEDPTLRERYGWREIEIAAFGTTSRGQAHRLGKWILDSEQNESETLTFTGGFDMADVRPGDIIQVADPSRQGVRRGGRIVQYNSGPGTIELDSEIESYESDTLLVVNVDGGIESLEIEAQSSGTTVTLVDTPSADLQPNSVFIHRGSSLAPEEWRVLSVRETDQHQFEVTCLTYDSTKYDRIESNIVLEPEPTSFLPTGPVLPPTDFTVFESLYKAGSAVNVRLDLSWKRPDDPRVGFYKVEVKEPNQQWRLHEVTPQIHSVIPNAEAGLWSFRITAGKNDQIAAGSMSSVLEVTDYTIVGKTAAPPNVTGLTAARGFSEVVLDWDDVDDLDLSGYQVRRGSAWDASDVEILADPVFASTYTATVKTAEAQKYHVRAVDTLGNLSEAVASISTSIQALPAVQNLYAYQVGDSVRVTWDAVEVIENIQYDIRYGLTSGSLLTAENFANVASAEFQGSLPVDATTNYRFYVRPYVTLTSGSRSYGTAASYDLTVYPLLNGLKLLSRTEETGWSSAETTAGDAFVEHARTPDFTAAEDTSFDVTYDYAETREISDVAEPTFHCNLNVSSTGTAEGLIFSAGQAEHYGMLACFNASGDLIIRAGVTDPILPQLADTTSMFGQWNLFETSGNRLDDFASNDLTVTGDVTAETLLDCPTMGIGAVFASGGYLTGSVPTIAGSDWTLSFRYRHDPYADFDGTVFQLGDVSRTLRVKFFDSTQTMEIEVYDSVNGGTTLSMAALDGTLAATSRVVIWYVESTKTLSCEMRNSDRDDVYGLVTDSVVLDGSIVDQGGSLYIGHGAHASGTAFEGTLSRFVFLKRAVTSDERWDLHHFIAPIQSPRLVIPAASVPKNTDMNLVWKLNKGDLATAASIEAWLNGTYYSQADPTACKMPGTYNSRGYVAFSTLWWMRVGTDNARYNKAHTGIWDGETGGFDSALSAAVTLNSDLSYWRDEPVISPLEVVSGALTLTDGVAYGAYEFPFNLPGVKIGRLWYESTSATIAADQLDIVDASMQINDADFYIAESFDNVDPQVSFWIDIGNTGTFKPFVPGTYQFQNATVRAVLQRGENELTRPSIENLTVHFTEQPGTGTLQASTTDATETVMTYDGNSPTTSNIPVIPDDFTARITGRLIGSNTANGDVLQIDFAAKLKRGTGAASTTVTYSYTELERDDDDWAFALAADTTNGGLSVKVTGEAATNIEWLCEVQIREVG